MHRRIRSSFVVPLLAAAMLLLAACGGSAKDDNSNVKSSSGVGQTSVHVEVGSDGLTAEQRNVRDRLILDNKPGSIKHLYVISPYSGQVLLYSTVRGKVTSSGKRLAPRSVVATDGNYVDNDFNGIAVQIGGQTRRTTEVIQDDGTYGDSVPYIYWWDVQGRYHQHFFTDGQILHLSDQPIAVKNIILNLEVTQTAPADQK